VLPFGVQSQQEAGDVVPGSESGAPVRPQLARKILANTVLAAVVWLILDFFYIRYFLNG
jgi:predicted secreted protein